MYAKLKCVFFEGGSSLEGKPDNMSADVQGRAGGQQRAIGIPGTFEGRRVVSLREKEMRKEGSC